MFKPKRIKFMALFHTGGRVAPKPIADQDTIANQDAVSN